MVVRAQHVEINYTPVTHHKQEILFYQKLNILNNLGNIYIMIRDTWIYFQIKLKSNISIFIL